MPAPYDAAHVGVRSSVLRLEPLRAWRFVAGKVSALGAVTSPPYDVLEPGIVPAAD
jgi:hypothetical protein